MTELAHITRHPIKSVGWEDIDTVSLNAGEWFPLDRVWAVAHERSQLTTGWAKKINFLRGVTDPSLMAVQVAWDADAEAVTLTHPEASLLTFHPGKSEDEPLFLEWLRRIWSPDLPQPTGLYHAEDAHLTDVPDPWIAINSLSSLRAISERAGRDLSRHRWRANLWLEGTAPWEELEWPAGKLILIGDVQLEVTEPITRCKATMANPDTGRRDTDTLGILNDMGHQEFGVYARVLTSGSVSVGDSVAFP